MRTYHIKDDAGKLIGTTQADNLLEAQVIANRFIPGGTAIDPRAPGRRVDDLIYPQVLLTKKE